MFKVDETSDYRVFSQDLGSRLMLQRKRDDMQVVLEHEDATDMLEKLQSAANDAVKHWWIDGYSNFFTKPVLEDGKLPANMVVYRSANRKPRR